MASAFFNALADPVKACSISAGTDPVERIYPEVIKAMEEAGFDISSRVPRKLTAELARGTALLVTMGCGDRCPFIPGLQMSDWPLPDPHGQSAERVREIRDDIRARVVELIRERGWGT